MDAILAKALIPRWKTLIKEHLMNQLKVTRNIFICRDPLANTLYCYLWIVPSIESLPYHASFTYESEEGKAHVYNLNTNNDFDESELNTIKFREIVDTYSIPREATRELVYLFRTILKNNLKGIEFENGMAISLTKYKVINTCIKLFRKNAFYSFVSGYLGETVII